MVAIIIFLGAALLAALAAIGLKDTEFDPAQDPRVFILIMIAAFLLFGLHRQRQRRRLRAEGYEKAPVRRDMADRLKGKRPQFRYRKTLSVTVQAPPGHSKLSGLTAAETEIAARPPPDDGKPPPG